jgi:hemerythrin-like metal-binding protein
MPLALEMSMTMGFAELDVQQQHLMATLLDVARKQREGTSRNNRKQAIERMVSLALTHIGTEERFLEGSRFPGLKDHRFRHKLFTAALADLQAEAVLHDFVLAAGTMEFLVSWLNTHVRNIDSSYVGLTGRARPRGSHERKV